MTNPTHEERDESGITVDFLLAQARLLGAAATDEAIRRFWSEMSEAMAALAMLGPVDDPLDVAFTPQWPKESRS